MENLELENLKKKVLEEIDKAVTKGKKVGLMAADFRRITGANMMETVRALSELKATHELILTKVGKANLYSPREMVDLYIKQKKGR